jgi:hypothetical protein
LDITERAIGQGWPLSPKKRAEIIEECARLALESASERVRVQAMRVLVMMDALNIRRERNEQDSSHEDRRIRFEQFKQLLSSSSDLTEMLKTLNTPPPPALPEKDEKRGGV